MLSNVLFPNLWCMSSLAFHSGPLKRPALGLEELAFSLMRNNLFSSAYEQFMILPHTKKHADPTSHSLFSLASPNCDFY